jgi:phosphopantothenoylcysteine decarboxylase/phosphopantothenate--cysteine ligase
VGNIGPATFGQDDNALLLVTQHGVEEFARDSKLALARRLVARCAELSQGIPSVQDNTA